MERANQENVLVWRKAVEDLKNQVITTTIENNSLQLEVETLKHEEEEDQIMAVLPLNAKARLMGLVTTHVSKAQNTILVAMWNLQ